MKRETGDSFASLAAILAQALTAALAADGRPGWELTPQLAPEPQGVAPLPGTLAFLLELRGARIAGEMLVLVEGDSAGILGRSDWPDTQHADALLRLFEHATPAIVAGVSTWLGPVTVVPSALSTAPTHEAGTVAMARLAGSDPGGRPVALQLCLDRSLSESLEVAARMAAAGAGAGIGPANLHLVMDVELPVSLRFGQRQLSLREVMDLRSGSVVELDREVDEPVELIWTAG